MNNFEFGEKMRARTKKFAVKVIKSYRKLPRADEARILGKQLIRAGTSVAANYRAVCRAKSNADFISKLGTTLEEADESLLWLELLEDSETVPPGTFKELMREADELLRIFSCSRATARHSQTPKLLNSQTSQDS